MRSQIDPKTLNDNVFSLIGDKWTLITAGTASHCNTMTASWGGLGVLWNKNVATVYIRPQRYTYGFVEESDYFTLSFFHEGYRKELALCGAKSGRDTDKFAACGFTVETAANGEAPYIAQASLVLVCKKLYWQDLDPAHFLSPDIEKNYHNDYHRVYIGEIVDVLKSENA